MDERLCALGKNTRDIPGDTAAGDVREALHPDGLKELQHRLDIDARRLEQIELARRRGALQDLADQRIAVGMRAARGEPEQRVSGDDRAAVDDALFLHHADAEAGEVVLALGIHAGHLGGLAADQRAATELAAARDALHHLRGELDVELAAGEIVEKEQRLRALHEHVVHAHRHEVDAHAVVALLLEGELELRADAVGARNQHRLAIFLRDLAQPAEAADAGEHLGAQRAARERLDRFDQRVAGVDVDAGVAVGEAFRHARVPGLASF